MCVHHSPSPSAGNVDGLVTLATRQELATLGQLGFKPPSPKRLRRKKRAGGMGRGQLCSQLPHLHWDLPQDLPQVLPHPVPAEGCWELGCR